MIEIRLEVFHTGAWIADVSDDETIDGTIEIDGQTWRGTVVSQTEQTGIYRARIVGGAGGLSKTIDAKHFDRITTYRDVAAYIAAGAGETLGDVPTGTVNQIALPESSAGRLLGLFCESAALTWWVDREGKIQIAESRTSSSTIGGIPVDSSTNSVTLDHATGIEIGATYDDILVSHYRLHQRGSSSKTTIYGQRLQTPECPIDYGIVYRGRVKSQNSDGTINVTIERLNLTIKNAAVLSGIPDSGIDFVAGDTVAVGFFGADGSDPYAIGTQQKAPQSGGKANARQDDAVAIGTLTLVPSTSLQFTPDGGVPGPPGTTVTITGRINAGNSRVRN